MRTQRSEMQSAAPDSPNSPNRTRRANSSASTVRLRLSRSIPGSRASFESTSHPYLERANLRFEPIVEPRTNHFAKLEHYRIRDRAIDRGTLLTAFHQPRILEA